MQNDDLVVILNLFMERALRIPVFRNEPSVSYFSIAILIKESFVLLPAGEYVEVEKVVENLSARIKKSYELLNKATNFGKCLDFWKVRTMFIIVCPTDF